MVLESAKLPSAVKAHVSKARFGSSGQFPARILEMDVPDSTVDPSDLDIGEELGELTEELVSEEPPAVAFLVRLFSQPAGSWQPVRALVAELGEVARKVGIVEDAYRISLQVLWHDCPAQGHGAGWAVVIFYSPEWHGVANTVLVDRGELALYRN